MSELRDKIADKLSEVDANYSPPNYDIADEIIQLVKEACKAQVEELDIDSRSSGHMINGFLIAKAEAIKAIDEV